LKRKDVDFVGAVDSVDSPVFQTFSQALKALQARLQNPVDKLSISFQINGLRG
jgi:molybdate-binding protein